MFGRLWHLSNNRLATGKGMECELLALLGGERFRDRGCGRTCGCECSRMIHVCFLLEELGVAITSLEETDNLDITQVDHDLLPVVEPSQKSVQKYHNPLKCTCPKCGS